MKQIIYIVLTLLLLVGCQNQESKVKPTVIKQTKQSTKIQRDVKKAFDNAQILQNQHSKWFERTEEIPLTIIATAYIDPSVLKTKEYKAYVKLLKEIEKDITILDKQSGINISSKYSSIKFINFESSSYAKAKFNLAYTHRYKDKEKLSDGLRPDVEKSGQELLIGLNLQELKKGNLTIEGYKTVKQKNKIRNSYYYTLRKTGYSKLNKKEKNRAIVDSLIATLQLSIPEYICIDRKELVKDGEVLRFITPTSKDKYKGEVWKYKVDVEIKKLTKDKQAFVNKREGEKTLKQQKLSDEKKIIVDKREYERDIKKQKLRKQKQVILYEKKVFLDQTKVLENKKASISKDIITFNGHKDKVSSVAITPNGKYVISGSYDTTLKLWDIKSGKEIKTLKGHKSYITAIVITPDGKYVISASRDETLKIWDIQSGSNIKTIKLSSAAWSLDITKDGKKVLLGGYGTIQLIDIKTGKKIKNFENKYGTVQAVAIDKNEKFILVGYSFVTIWNMKTAKKVKTLSGKYVGGIRSLVISKDGKHVIVGASNCVEIWNIKTGQKVITFKRHKGRVNTVAINSVGGYALSGDGDNIKLLDIDTGEEVKKFRGHKYTINSIAISQDGKYVISGSEDKSLKRWSLPLNKKEEKRLKQSFSKTKQKKLDGLIAKEKSTKAIYTKKEKKQLKLIDEKYVKLNRYDNYKKEITLLTVKIQKLIEYASYKEDLTKQNIISSSFSQNDMNTLQNHSYCNQNTKDKLALNNINKIASSLNYSFLDPVITTAFSTSYIDLTNSKVTNIKKALWIQAQESYTVDEVYFTSDYNYKDGGYKKLYSKENIVDTNNAYEITQKEY